MSSPYRTREATTADVAVIVRQRRLMFEEIGNRDAARNDAMDAAVAAQLAEMIPSGEYRGWLVCTPAGEVVAGAGLSIGRVPGTPRNSSGVYTYLMSMWVEPPHRRQGLAHHLMRTMVEWSRAQGIVEIKLHASDMGRPIYEGLGFRQTNEMRLLLEA
ncbi:MAG: GNAT family N-acetyltransferase [Chloroflexi bacterium]|nr:GNAT family N-acetyltransferase [Chloroflexota bacterium]